MSPTLVWRNQSPCENDGLLILLDIWSQRLDHGLLLWGLWLSRLTMILMCFVIAGITQVSLLKNADVTGYLLGIRWLVLLGLEVKLGLIQNSLVGQ